MTARPLHVTVIRMRFGRLRIDLERVGQPLIRFLKASSPCRNHSQQMKRLEVLGIGVEHEPAKTLCLNQLSALKKCDGVAHRLCDSERSCARRRALPGLG